LNVDFFLKVFILACLAHNIEMCFHLGRCVQISGKSSHGKFGGHRSRAKLRSSFGFVGAILWGQIQR